MPNLKVDCSRQVFTNTSVCWGLYFIHLFYLSQFIVTERHRVLHWHPRLSSFVPQVSFLLLLPPFSSTSSSTCVINIRNFQKFRSHCTPSLITYYLKDNKRNGGETAQHAQHFSKYKCDKIFSRSAPSELCAFQKKEDSHKHIECITFLAYVTY